MNIRKHEKLIEIKELGFNLEIKADLLLSNLLREETKKSLTLMVEKRLADLLVHFKEINQNKNIISKSEERNQYIYEYCCLLRDLQHIIPVPFENFYDENSDLLEFIHNEFKYKEKYGFIPFKEVNI